MPNPLPCSSSSRDDGDRSSEGCPTDFPYFISVPGWDPFGIVNASENCLTSIMAKRAFRRSYSEDIVRKGILYCPSFKYEELSLNDR
ncbi:hypothetical protein CDAR_383571 [Caerostris darwini]|uniref:Uncharacterized protein n=1 Tax=Caerostris darwini TaxID=1538125 RepID=A0AAV4Q459_9ARAC|nr:hypothetical protein CDAR_383571 [Caerostris darwini]